jgi:hypothetical protein
VLLAHVRRAFAVWLVVVSAALAGAEAPAPALTKPEIEHFLKTAKVVGAKGIPKGVTYPVRLTLSNGTLRHDAAFSDANDRRPVMRFAKGPPQLNFVDFYGYSIAAYRLAEVLGLDDMMPVTVERGWNGRRGALSWWLDVKMDEAQRVKEGLQPPDPEAWICQMHRMRVFTQLVADTDRNLGNLLISADWKLWMIDFTRAFRRNHDLLAPGDLTRCDRALLVRLRSLTKAEVKTKTRPYLDDGEIAALMARRDLIVARFDTLVAEQGEARVVY